jgi:uncharacterized membrane protein
MTKQAKIQKLTVLSVLSAIVAIVSFLPIKTLGLEITLSMVPVAIGAMMYGASGGAILGFVFGMVSFLQCLGWSAFGVVLFGINPLFTFLVCVPTRILAGLLAGLLVDIFKKNYNMSKWSVLLAAVFAPILNTVFFMSGLVLCFYNTDYIQGFVTALNAANPFIFVVLFVGINGLVEIIAGIILATPCGLALKRALRK